MHSIEKELVLRLVCRGAGGLRDFDSGTSTAGSGFLRRPNASPAKNVEAFSR